ncbi:MAG: hypothetical protein AAB930_02370 [Patescibacteria group bacterium]
MKAYVYTCFDPMVWPHLVEIFDQRFGRHNYFFDPDPGAVKNLVSPSDSHLPKIVISKIKAAYTLHPFEFLILVNHSKCGAYKLVGKEFTDAAKEEEFHKRELGKAAPFLKKNFPSLIIEAHYFLKEESRMVW